jgi:hypothetical protein
MVLVRQIEDVEFLGCGKRTDVVAGEHGEIRGRELVEQVDGFVNCSFCACLTC